MSSTKTHWSVVVVGGGTAGLIAGIAAARMGARTLSVERGGFRGGNAATGMNLGGFFDGNEKQVLPTRKSVLEQPFFQAQEAAYLRWWMGYVAERSEHVINVATFAQLNEAMVDALHEVLLNPGTNIKKILDDAVKRYNQASRG